MHENNYCRPFCAPEQICCVLPSGFAEQSEANPVYPTEALQEYNFHLRKLMLSSHIRQNNR